MFLDKCIKTNSKLIEFGCTAHTQGKILPDTYILDVDNILLNAKYMLNEANKNGVVLFFMLKQIGRNPYIAKKLMDIGYKGCVAVDYKEALVMIDNDIHLGNVGHLVQVPHFALRKIIKAKPDVITVYSKQKIKEINEICQQENIIQPLMIRITDDDASLYSGQIAGFTSDELPELIEYISSLSNVTIGGITTFPALLYDGNKEKITVTTNINGINRAKEILAQYHINDILINLPSATCVSSISLIKQLGGNNGEPGHGLTGTTPLHKASEQKEKISYIYVSEISHNYKDKSYCYGGGHYRRGHIENVLVGPTFEDLKTYKITAPDDDSIDYHFEIAGNCDVGDTCIMCFRTQIFTTRSHIALVEGLNANDARIVGIYDSQGKRIEVNW